MSISVSTRIKNIKNANICTNSRYFIDNDFNGSGLTIEIFG